MRLSNVGRASCRSPRQTARHCVAARAPCIAARVTDAQVQQAITEATLRTLVRPSDVASYWDIVDELLQAQRREREKQAAFDPLEAHCQHTPWDLECRLYDV